MTEDESELDRLFFQQNPDREYCARLAISRELNLMKKFGSAQIPANMFWFAVVRQLAPGLRARYYIGAEMPSTYLKNGIPERVAKDLFERASNRDDDHR